MADNLAFHRPADIGFFDIGITQTTELMTLTTVNGSFIAGMKIVFLYSGNVVKTYTDGVEIAITVGNKEAIITFNGADFSGYVDQTLDAELSCFKAGEVTAKFKLGIVKTNL